MEQNQNIQTQNNAFVIGVLKEKKLTFKPDSNGRQMCTGSLTVETDTKLGKGEVEVKVMQYAEKKDGGSNSLYKALRTIEDEYKSIVKDGREAADTIKAEGELTDGTYYSVNKGEFVEKLELKATFINRIPAETEHCCKVGFEGYISAIEPAKDTLNVTVVGVGYNGVAIPVTGVIPAELVAPFQSRYKIGCTATLNFAIINTVETKEVQSQVGFGEGLGEVITTVHSKKIIFGGSPANYNGLNEEQIKRAFAMREVELEKKKEKAIKNKANAGTNMQNGFGGATNGFPTNGGGFSVPTGDSANGFAAAGTFTNFQN